MKELGEGSTICSKKGLATFFDPSRNCDKMLHFQTIPSSTNDMLQIPKITYEFPKNLFFCHHLFHMLRRNSANNFPALCVELSYSNKTEPGVSRGKYAC